MRTDLWPGDSHAGEIASYFTGTLEEPEAVFFAEFEPGFPIALIELSIRWDISETHRSPTGYVEGLYVEPAYRAKGVARSLLRAAQQWALEEGCTYFASDRADRIIVDKAYAKRAARSNNSFKPKPVN